MTIRLPLIALAATLVLSACNKDDHTIVAEGPADPMANQLANAAPVELPAPIVETKKYRCADGSVVQLDWREKDNKPAGANLRIGDSAEPTVLVAGTDGTGPITAPDGTSLTGSRSDSSVTVTLPGKSGQTCKA